MWLGSTESALEGQYHLGGADAFIRKYDTKWHRTLVQSVSVWNRWPWTASMQFPPEIDGVIVAGIIQNDVIIQRYDANGNLGLLSCWGDSTNGSAISIHASGVYMAGTTNGTFTWSGRILGSTDAFIRKYDLNGMELWTHQFGTAGIDEAAGIHADGSGVYVVGSTENVLPDQNQLARRRGCLYFVSTIPKVTSYGPER